MSTDKPGKPARPAKRPKYITGVLPECLVVPVEDLKDTLQAEGVSLTGRQVIGRDGIAIALLAEATTLDLDEVRKRVLRGIEIIKSHESDQGDD